MSILDPNSVIVKFDNLPTSNGNKAGDFFTIFNPSENRTYKLSNASLKIGLDNITFKPLIDKIVSDIALAKIEAQNSIHGKVFHVEYVTGNTKDGIIINPFENTSIGHSIEFNQEHVNSFTQAPTVSANSLSLVNTATDCTTSTALGVPYGLQPNKTTFVLPKGLYKINAKATARATSSSSDTLFAITNKTIKNGTEETIVISSDKKHLQSDSSASEFTMNGFYYLCKDSELELKVWNTRSILIGDYNSNGQLGKLETGISNLDIPVVPAFVQFELIGSTDTLKPTHGGTRS